MYIIVLISKDDARCYLYFHCRWKKTDIPKETPLRGRNVLLGQRFTIPSILRDALGDIRCQIIKCS